MRFLVIVFILFCQQAQAQVGFGPELGIGMSSMHFAPEQGYTSASYKPVISGKLGGVVDVPLNKKAYLQSGIFLSEKGQDRHYSYNTNDSNYAFVHQTLSMSYIEVPVSLLYKTGVQGKGRAVFGIGVTASYLVGGKNKLNAYGKFNDTAFTTNINPDIIADKTVAFFDLGVNLTAGYELPSGLFFHVYYTAGIKDIGLGTEIDKNRMWGVAAGYFFGRGRNINKETDDLIDKGQ